MTDQHDARDALSTEVLADLMTLHGRATPGTWAQGTSSHHTVSKREGKEDYHVANFHHADDASFIDNAHNYMPLLIEEIHRLRAATQPTKPEQQAGGVPAGWMDKFEEMLEDYAGARAEVAIFNATQRSGMTVRLPKPRLKSLIDHVESLAAPSRSAVQPLSNAQFVKCIETAGFKTWDSRMWSLKREIEASHGIVTEETSK